MPAEPKSLGTAIDEIVAALSALDAPARATAVKAACDHLNLSMPVEARNSSDAIAAALSKGVSSPSDAGTPTTAIDIRSFKEQKNPSSGIEMACVMAYYLLQHSNDDRKTEITAADVQKYFVQANYPLPKRLDQLLVNAKVAGYFDSAGRGTYRLNAVGHNLVAHSMPRVGASRTAAAQGRGAKKKDTAKIRQSSRKNSRSLR